jgi:hypothetical protein
LNSYKKVNSGGAYLNNIGYTVDSKLDFESTHKFSLCIENAIYEGYTSEKIVDGFLANTIPIYYGNPNITEDFESGSFINLHDFKSLEEALRYIIQIDTDDSLYLEKLNSNKLKFYKNDLIDEFIMSIMNNPIKRVPVNYYTKRHKYHLILSSKINSIVLIKKILNYLSLKN